MPSYPNASPTATGIRGSVFSGLAHRIETQPGEVYPLHVGDTWMEPPAGARMEDLRVDERPGLHRYAPPGGLPALVDLLVERSRERHGVPIERRNVMVAAGATAALAAVVGTLVEPGEEVLILAPYWPLIEGIVRSFRGVPVPVPVWGEVDSPSGLVERLRERAGERTVAVYVNSPNNPTGQVLPRDWIEALVGWALETGRWILADEVYEHYAYRGEPGLCRPLAPEQTFSVHSFSKAFGMAGNRCGYVVGPSAVMAEVNKLGTHLFYSAPTASQLAASRVLGEAGDAWLAAAASLYERLGTRSAERLGVDPPDGGTFLFLDVGAYLDDRGLLGFLEDCADRGVFLAPGPSFGPYPRHVRLCFTAVEPSLTERGVAVLESLLDSKPRREANR